VLSTRQGSRRTSLEASRGTREKTSTSSWLDVAANPRQPRKCEEDLSLLEIAPPRDQAERDRLAGPLLFASAYLALENLINFGPNSASWIGIVSNSTVSCSLSGITAA
jgi:hypothetical protein